MTVRKLKPLQCCFYVIGQIVGAFLGAALVYLVYWSQFNAFDGGIRQITGLNRTADIFFTMPGKNIPHWNALVDQIVSTGLLLIFIMALEQVIYSILKSITYRTIIFVELQSFDFGSNQTFCAYFDRYGS